MNLSPLNTLIRQARARVVAGVEGGREKDVGVITYAAAYRVLNFNLGRSAGHTTYIRDDFAEGEDLAIIVRGSSPELERMAGVFTDFTAAINYMKGKSGFRDIWIDEPTKHLRNGKDVQQLQELIHMWRGRPKYPDGLMIFLGAHTA